MNELAQMDFEGFKSGYVALIGKPNVGKSTLLNAYLGQKIAAVSIKPQTTQRRQLGILTLPNAQVVFVDSPGLHSGDYKLSQFINQEAYYALMDADLILFMVDASQPPDVQDHLLVAQVQEKSGDTPKLLVLNKMDLVSPDIAGERLRSFQALMDFDDHIQISAVTQAGQGALLDRILACLPEGPQYFPEEQVTETHERDIAEALIRAAAMHHLQEELPWAVFVRVNDYTLREPGKRYVHATVFVERDSHKGIVIGKGGRMIKKISTTAREEIEKMSGESVFLDLQVKVEKNWRNNMDFLRRHGLSYD